MRLSFPFLKRLSLVARRSLVLVVALLTVMGGIRLWGYIYPSYVAKNWDAISHADEQGLAQNLRSSFLTYQEEALRTTELVLSDNGLRRELARGESASRRILFESLTSVSPEDFSVELYDRHKTLVAWSGIQGAAVDTALLQNTLTSTAIQGPIYSYLVVIMPIDAGPARRWYGIGKRLLDVNFPISNRFISNEAFSTTFTSRLRTGVEFDFSSYARPSVDEKIMTVELTSIDGKSIGLAYMARPMLAAYEEENAGEVNNLIDMIVMALVAVVVWLAVYTINKIQQLYMKLVLFTLSIWLSRYILVWMNIPQSIGSFSVFESIAFASSFGFGIAHSIGDLFLSSVLLLVNVWFISAEVGYRLERFVRTAGRRSVGRTMMAVIFVVSLAFLTCFFVRGLAATIHSAVFDSTLTYNDPTFVIPSLELSLMLLSLGFIAAALVIASLTIARMSWRIMSSAVAGHSEILRYALLLAIFTMVSMIFGAVQRNPLMGQLVRLGIVDILMATALVLEHRNEIGDTFFSWRRVPIIVVLAISLLVPMLDTEVHELDRAHVEILAGELTQPADNWFNVVANRALDELSDDQAAAALLSNRKEEIEKLAFTQWARSILSKEGNNCSVRFMNRKGEVVSDFHIGITPYLNREQIFEIAPTKRHVDMGETGSQGGIRWQRGYTPVMTESGELAGGVWIEISTGKRSFLHGEAPELLTNYTQEHFEAHYRNLEVSEYDHHGLALSTNESFPVGRAVPAEVREAHENIWLHEIIKGRRFETYYAQDQADRRGDSWIAFSLQDLDFRWHIYSYLRYIIFYLLVAGLLFAGYYGVRFLRRSEGFLAFRAKLLLAFIVVSVIPIFILALYNRQYAVERASVSAIKKIQEQTSLIAGQLERQDGPSVPASLSQLTNEQCSVIADQLDADFSVYNGSVLQATSKPEVYTAELLDERLSAPAYMNIYLEKLNFFSEQRSIGTLPYVVGYRPIVSENGSVIGAVSMPTLFRQSEIDEELTKRNVFLFGAYAIALILALLIGTLFAKRIASPILRLKSMTTRVAEGDLDMQIGTSRKDEIGELERAFNEMTRKLKRSRDEMLEVQRELAWKEVAQQVAHEIKNPLTPMKLSIQHLRRAYEDGVKDFRDVLHQVSATILSQIDALSRIASEFSQHARMPERRVTHCSVHAVLQEARSLFQQHSGVRFTSELSASRDLVEADHDELTRVFINVIRNAIQAMEEKGTISLATASENDQLVVRISDTGPGIPLGLKSRLFTPNLSMKTDGMGLGLSIVRKTISDLKGTVSIESLPGQGTTVVMRLPTLRA